MGVATGVGVAVGALVGDGVAGGGEEGLGVEGDGVAEAVGDGVAGGGEGLGVAELVGDGVAEAVGDGVAGGTVGAGEGLTGRGEGGWASCRYKHCQRHWLLAGATVLSTHAAHWVARYHWRTSVWFLSVVRGR